MEEPDLAMCQQVVNNSVKLFDYYTYDVCRNILKCVLISRPLYKL